MLTRAFGVYILATLLRVGVASRFELVEQKVFSTSARLIACLLDGTSLFMLLSLAQRLRMKLTVAALILFSPASALAQKYDVTIVHRQDNETEYTYVVPGRVSAPSDSNVNCTGDSDQVKCNGSTTTGGYITPARQVSYQVRGATFSPSCSMAE
jgi:hypothetical protein